jgi:hypothetical protein
MLIVNASPVSATAVYRYAGYGSFGSYEGIKGMLAQTTTSTVSFPWHHNVDITVCASGCGEWVQTGEYQGYLPNSDSPDVVDIYWENEDACLGYFQGDAGQPGDNWKKFFLTYDGTGPHTTHCTDGQGTYYVFEYRKGQFANVPFHKGHMGVSAGIVVAQEELYKDSQGTIPESTDYFGCTSQTNCNDQSSGFQTFDSGTWTLWTADGGHTGPNNPPYQYDYHQWWAYRACATASACS